MKKHRGWKVANLFLVLIVLCLATSRMGESRPYRFLEGSTLVQYSVGPRLATTYFGTSAQMHDLVILADTELAAHGLVRQMHQDWDRSDAYCSYLHPRGTPGVSASVHMQKSLGRTRIIVSRPATISDRVQAFLFNLRSRL